MATTWENMVTGKNKHYLKMLTRIPLIIAPPNTVNNGAISSSPVELIDLYPTLMDLTNINILSMLLAKV